MKAYVVREALATSGDWLCYKVEQGGVLWRTLPLAAGILVE